MKDVKSPLTGLRFHDLRHHVITELAESQASDGTIMAIAGHVSPKMLQRYSHIRIQAKRTVLDSISTRRADSVNLEELEVVTTQTTTQNRAARLRDTRKLLKRWWT